MKPTLVDTNKATCDWFDQMRAEWATRAAQYLGAQNDTLERRQEKLALIRLLRDTTDSNSIYQRCVAIVGERS